MSLDKTQAKQEDGAITLFVAVHQASAPRMDRARSGGNRPKVQQDDRQGLARTDFLEER